MMTGVERETIVCPQCYNPATSLTIGSLHRQTKDCDRCGWHWHRSPQCNAQGEWVRGPVTDRIIYEMITETGYGIWKRISTNGLCVETGKFTIQTLYSEKQNVKETIVSDPYWSDQHSYVTHIEAMGALEWLHNYRGYRDPQ